MLSVWQAVRTGKTSMLRSRNSVYSKSEGSATAMHARLPVGALGSGPKDSFTS